MEEFKKKVKALREKRGWSQEDLARKIDVEIDQRRLRPSDVTLQIPCIDKFVEATGWKPEIKFEQTLEDTLDYWRDYFKRGK